MSRQRALWRKAFDSIEAPVGGWLHSGVHRDDFHEAMTAAKRLQRGVVRPIESVSTSVLHLLNIPARRDMRRATAQLTRIERELRVIGDAVERLEANDKQARP